MAKGRVFVVGSVNVDLVTRIERFPKPGQTVLGEDLRRFAGGKGANQAIAARQAGAQVKLLAAAGDDEGGRAYRRRLEARGVDCSGLLLRPGAVTGHAFIAVDEAGENTIVVVSGANATLAPSDLETLEDLGPDDVLLAQLEVPLPTVSFAARKAAARGARVLLNLAPYALLPADIIALADPVIVNQGEALQLADSAVIPRSVIVTYGKGGASWDELRAEGTPVPEAEVVDSTGAGDAFCGALAAALAEGCERAEALDRALSAGAACVRREGAQDNPLLEP
jgi:ribokinase